MFTPYKHCNVTGTVLWYCHRAWVTCGINTRGTTLPPCWIYSMSRGLVSTNQIFFASETKTERKNRKTGARELSSLFLVFPPFDFQMAKEAPLNSLKISELSLTILSYMHVLCRRADLLKKSTFLGIIILIFFACALRHCRVMTGYYVTLKYQAKLRTIAWKVFATLKCLDSTWFCLANMDFRHLFHWENYISKKPPELNAIEANCALRINIFRYFAVFLELTFYFYSLYFFFVHDFFRYARAYRLYR